MKYEKAFKHLEFSICLSAAHLKSAWLYQSLHRSNAGASGKDEELRGFLGSSPLHSKAWPVSWACLHFSIYKPVLCLKAWGLLTKIKSTFSHAFSSLPAIRMICSNTHLSKSSDRQCDAVVDNKFHMLCGILLNRIDWQALTVFYIAQGLCVFPSAPDQQFHCSRCCLLWCGGKGVEPGFAALEPYLQILPRCCVLLCCRSSNLQKKSMELHAETFSKSRSGQSRTAQVRRKQGWILGEDVSMIYGAGTWIWFIVSSGLPF